MQRNSFALVLRALFLDPAVLSRILDRRFQKGILLWTLEWSDPLIEELERLIRSKGVAVVIGEIITTLGNAQCKRSPFSSCSRDSSLRPYHLVRLNHQTHHRSFSSLALHHQLGLLQFSHRGWVRPVRILQGSRVSGGIHHVATTLSIVYNPGYGVCQHSTKRLLS